jgi:hypothetical protein
MTTTKYDVYRVTNVSKHESVYVGSVHAWDIEDARRVACDHDLIRDFETFTVAEFKLRDGITVEAA